MSAILPASPAPFVVFEGPEGAGKTLQAQRLTEYMRSIGLLTEYKREPGGTPYGERLRRFILDVSLDEVGELDPFTEFLVFSSGRRELIKVIKRLRDDGIIVVGDRNFLSSLTLQGHGSGANLDMINLISEYIIQPSPPTITLILYVPWDVGLARRHDRGVTDRMEQRDLQFHQRVTEGYLIEAKKRGYPIIDATQPVDDVAAAIWSHVAPLVREWQEATQLEPAVGR